MLVDSRLAHSTQGAIMERGEIVSAVGRLITDKFTPSDPITEQDYPLELEYLGLEGDDDLSELLDAINEELVETPAEVTLETTFDELVDKIHALKNP